MPAAPAALMRLLRRCLPQTLVARVFALYALALAGSVLTGLLLFTRYQFSQQIASARADAGTLLSVLAPAVTDAAVIGDYDSIHRLLQRAVRHTSFSELRFADPAGGEVREADPPGGDAQAPAWLTEQVRLRLLDIDQPLQVGGRDYGHLHLVFSSDTIAGGFWRLARALVLMGVAGLGLGLLIIRLPLQRWLGNLDRIQHFEAEIGAGDFDSRRVLAEDAPLEFRQTFEVLDRAARQVVAQRAEAAVTLDAIADAVLTVDEAGRILFANLAAGQLLSQPPADLVGQPLAACLPGQQAGLAAPAADASTARRLDFRMADGRLRVLDLSWSAVSVGGVRVLACRDVTEQQRLDLALQEELRRRSAAVAGLRLTLEAAAQHQDSGTTPMPLTPLPVALGTGGGIEPAADGDLEAVSGLTSRLVDHLQERTGQLDAIFALSPDGFVAFNSRLQVSYVSAAFSALTGLARESLPGLEAAALFDQLAERCSVAGVETLQLLRRRMADEALPGDPDEHQLVELLRPATRTLELAVRRSVAGRLGIVACVLHLRDVTRDKEVEQMKSDFLTLAAHELRTPMSSIFGFAEILISREMAPDRQKDVLRRIHRQSEVMISILNELLDISRIEARRGRDFARAELDLAQVGLDALASFEPPDGREAPLVDLPLAIALVRGDPERLQRALHNLVVNAYKYSPAGGPVRLMLRVESGAEGHRGRVGLVVEDQGIGLTPEQQARIGDRFWRADKSGNIPGTGLGVSIVREIAELHGGNLQVQSVVGKGSRFTLWLPLWRPGLVAVMQDPELSRAALSI